MKQFLQTSINHNCFSKQTPEADFWAGFIAADGCIHNGYLNISQQWDNKYFIEKFAKWCNSHHKIVKAEKKSSKYNKSYYQAKLYFKSKF